MRNVTLWFLVTLSAGVSFHAGAADLPNGKAVFDSTCAACHATGVAGAPKLGDVDAWAPRIKTGPDALYASAIKGKGAMPPKGGNANLSNAEVQAAVNYILSQSDAAVKAAPAKGEPKPAVAVAEAKPARADAAPKAAPQPAAGGDAAKGKSVFQSTCAACHATGVAGAPKVGDTAAWAPRIKTGTASLYQSALGGKGAMPAKGGNAGLADADVKAAVDYMASQSGGAVAAKTAAPAAVTAKPAEAPAKTTVPEPPNPAAAAPPQPAPSAAVPAAPAVAAAQEANAFNRLLRPLTQRNLPPAEDSIHDPANDGTLALQAPLTAFGVLPKSNAGNRVDWVKSLAENKIQPRFDKVDPKVPPVVMDLNIVRQVKGSMPDVVYPHKQHTEWLDCSNCHPAIFLPQKGANQISMAAILLGQKCGVCHGKVAFPVSECRLCHSKTKTTATATTEAKQ